MQSKIIKEIKIGFSCHEEWSIMHRTDNTRQCKSCNKSVYNFSNLTNHEVIEFLSKRSNENTCGKFNQSQIESINLSIQSSQHSNTLKPFIFATTITTMVACGTSKHACEIDQPHNRSKVEIISEVNNPDTTNTILICGQVLNETNEPIIGANFVLDGTKFGCITDIDGKFKLEVSKNEINVNKASVQYVGYETFQIPLADIKNKEIKIELLDLGVLLGEVVIIKQPIYKRLWYEVKNIFR